MKTNITYLAETDVRGDKVKFGIKNADRNAHIYVLGKTGMGKSTLLENIAVQDIRSGEGVIFIDPHGSSAERILEHIPENRIKDVLYFNPQDRENPVAFNILDDIDVRERSVITEGLVRLFEDLWSDKWTSKVEYILRNAIDALFANPGSTILDINRMFTDEEFRKEVVYGNQEETVRSFWMKEFPTYTETFKREVIDVLVDNLHRIVTDQFVMPIVGQKYSSFSIGKMMREKKIILINLSKGSIGEGASKFLGGVLVTRIYLEALSRSRVHEFEFEKIPQTMLFIDELQTISNHSFADMFSFARNCKLALTIAHQYTGQMSDRVRKSILGNVGTTISFSLGAEDAKVLGGEFAPTFSEKDLCALGCGEVHLKLMIDGKTSDPFTANTLDPLMVPKISYQDQTIESSRKQFSSREDLVSIERKRSKSSGDIRKIEEASTEKLKKMLRVDD